MNDRLSGASSVFDFEALYKESADPWNFSGSSYEQQRYASTIAALSRDRYGSAFEPGCSVGELTARLAARCASVLATDVSASAVARAGARCAALANVELRCEALSESLPDRVFDLVVFSEIAYYFEREGLLRIVQALPSRLATGGEFVAVHWLGFSPDHALHADEVHALLLEHLPLRHRYGERFSGFRIDSWVRE